MVQRRSLQRRMIQQQRRAENDRRELTLDLAFVGLGSRDSSYWHNAPKFNHQAAMALFIGVNHGRGADLARIEMGFPAETAARGVGGLVGGEANPASFWRHSHFTTLSCADRADPTSGFFTSRKAEGAQIRQERGRVGRGGGVSLQVRVRTIFLLESSDCVGHHLRGRLCTEW